MSTAAIEAEALESGRGVDSYPKVSVVICAFDEQRMEDLAAAVESVRRQSEPAHEIIVAVDRNDDLLDRVRRNIPDVIAVANTFHAGAGGARNSGVAASSGDVFAFIDDDVRASEDWLAELLPTLSDPSVMGAGGWIDPRWDGERPSWFPLEFDWVVGSSYRGLPGAEAAVRNVIAANMAVRRDVFEAVNGFLPGFGKRGKRSEPEETEFCIRAGRRFPGMRWLYVPTAQVSHRVPAERQTYSYFFRRCIHEGRGKARMKHVSESLEVLTAERAYVRETLPSGVFAGLRRALRGDLRGIQTSGAIIGGVSVTAAAYAAETLSIKLGAPAAADKEVVPLDSGTQSAGLVTAGRVDAQLVETRPAISPTVGVVIACYTEDRWDLLLHVIDRICSQSLAPLEIVVVVDHNDALLRRLNAAAPVGVTVMASRGHAGAGGARNTGARRLDTDLVAFVDDDVDPAPDWLARLTDRMEQTEVVGAGGCVLADWATGEPWWFPRECGWVVGARDGSHAQTVRNIWSAGMIVDRVAFIDAEGFRSDFGKVGLRSEPEDTELCLRLSFHTGRHWLFDPEARMRHHVRAEQASPRYFFRRCWMEGRGKAALRSVTTRSQPVLVEERAFVTQILPRAVAAHLRAACTGHPAGLVRAAMLTMGTFVTCVGFLAGRMAPSSAALHR